MFSLTSPENLTGRQVKFIETPALSNFETFGSNFLNSEHEVEITKERKEKDFFLTQYADERGVKAMSKEAENFKQKMEKQNRERLNLERGKQFSRDLTETSQQVPRNILSSDSGPSQRLTTMANLPTVTGGTRPYLHVVQREKIIVEMDAFAKAEQENELRKNRENQQLMQRDIRDYAAKERFSKAIEKERLEQEYIETTKMLQKAQHVYRQQTIKTLSRANQDIPAMCTPVDNLMKRSKQQQMEAAVEKILNIGKEHAIDDDETQDLTTRVGDESLSSVFDTAYIETSPITDLTLQPSTAVENQSIAIPRKRDVAVQVDDLPLSKCIQVNLDSSISDMELLPSTMLSNDHKPPVSRHRDASVQTELKMLHLNAIECGVHTRTNDQIDLPRLGLSRDMQTQKQDGSRSFSCTTSYKSIPPGHGLLMLPQLLTPPSQNSISPNVSELESTNSSNQPTHRRYFAPISDDSDQRTSPRSLGKHLQHLASKYGLQKDSDSETECSSVIPKKPISVAKQSLKTSVSSIETSKSSERKFTKKNSPAKQKTTRQQPTLVPAVNNFELGQSSVSCQAIPLSEPIRERPKGIYDFSESDNSPSPVASSAKSKVDQIPPEVSKMILQNLALKILHKAPASKASSEDLTKPDTRLPLDFSNLSQSYFDIQNEQLPDISMLANLSDVELTKLGSELCLTDLQSDRSLPTTSSDESLNRSQAKRSRLEAIHQAVLDQLKFQYPTLEGASYQQDISEDEHGETFEQQQGSVVLQKIYNGGYVHELSTIQEVDSALTDSMGASRMSISKNEDSSGHKSRRRSSTTKRVSPLISLINVSLPKMALDSVIIVSPKELCPSRTSSSTSERDVELKSTIPPDLVLAERPKIDASVSLTLTTLTVDSRSNLDAGTVEDTPESLCNIRQKEVMSFVDTLKPILCGSANNGSGTPVMTHPNLIKAKSLFTNIAGNQVTPSSLLQDTLIPSSTPLSSPAAGVPKSIENSSGGSMKSMSVASTMSSIKTIGSSEGFSDQQSMLTSTKIHKNVQFPGIKESPILPNAFDTASSVDPSYPVDSCQDTPQPVFAQISGTSTDSMKPIIANEFTLKSKTTDVQFETDFNIKAAESVDSAESFKSVNFVPIASEDCSDLLKGFQPILSDAKTTSSATSSSESLSQMFRQSKVALDKKQTERNRDLKLLLEVPGSQSIQSNVTQSGKSTSACTISSDSMTSFLQHETSALLTDGHVTMLSTPSLDDRPITPLQQSSEAECSSDRSNTASSKKDSTYKDRTKRLWNKLPEVQEKKKSEDRKKEAAQNRERMKKFQMKLQRQRTKTPKK